MPLDEQQHLPSTDTTGQPPVDDVLQTLGDSGGQGDSALIPDTIQIVQEQPTSEEIALVENTKEFCDATNTEIQKSVDEYMAACANQCRAVANDCIGCYLSILDDTKRRVEKTAGKCGTAVVKYAADRVAIAVESMQFAVANAPQPEIDKVANLCSLGDYIHSGGKRWCLYPVGQPSPEGSRTAFQFGPYFAPAGYNWAEWDEGTVPPPTTIPDTPTTTPTPTPTTPPINPEKCYKLVECTPSQTPQQPCPTTPENPFECDENSEPVWMDPSGETNNLLTEDEIGYRPEKKPDGCRPKDTDNAPGSEDCTDTAGKGAACTPQPIERFTACEPNYLVSQYKSAQDADHTTQTGFPGPIFTPEGQAEPGFWESFWNGITFSAGDWISKANPTESIVRTIYALSQESTETALKGAKCNAGSFVKYAIQGGTMNFAGGWLGTIPQALIVSNQYLQNLSCQYLIPSLAELNNLRARRFITDDQWEAGVAANGMCVPWAKCLRDANFLQMNVGEVISAYRREAIDIFKYEELADKAGVKDKEQLRLYEEITKQIPGPQDIVRFMVRDVFDENVVGQFGYDQEFGQKYIGQAKKWGKAQGLDDETFKYFWRAHWQIPSATQLYEMLHRIRKNTPLPGSNEVAEAVKTEDVINALKINDMAPAWVNRLVAISYRPMGRIDIRRAYELDQIPSDEIDGKFQDLGYSPNDARTMANYTRADSADRRAAKLGVMNSKEIAKAFQQDWLSRNDAETALAALGFQPNTINAMLETALFRRNISFKQKVMNAAKRKYMTGEYDVGELQAKLIQIGVDQNAISSIISNWTLELELKSKQPTVAMLCKWHSRSYIDTPEFIRRVKNLGYSLEDAAKIVAVCTAETSERRAKELQAALEKAARTKKQQIKDAKQAYLDSLPCKPPAKPVCNGTA